MGEVRWVSAEVTDQSLKHTLEFGIGIHHAGLPERDRKAGHSFFNFVALRVGGAGFSSEEGEEGNQFWFLISLICWCKRGAAF